MVNASPEDFERELAKAKQSRAAAAPASPEEGEDGAHGDAGGRVAAYITPFSAERLGVGIRVH